MKKSSLKLVVLCLLVCSLLTGCMGIHFKTEIKADGSGTMEAFVGFTEEFINEIDAMGGTTTGEMNDKMTINGVTYAGDREKKDFANLEELNNLLKSEGQEGVDTGSWRVYELNGDLYLELKTSPSTGNTLEIASSAGVATDDLDAEQLKQLEETMTMIFEFKFPKNITQISGPTEGITINNETLTLNLIRMSGNFETTYTFTTAEGVCEPPVETPIASPTPTEIPNVPVGSKTFTDVTSDKWFYDAVMALAEGGLVEGVGNNEFAPHNNMTYAAFCQVLARAKFLDYGAENGYWAYKAIKSCIDAGYVFSLGDITSANYDVPITREAAIYAMVKARQVELFLADKKVSSSDIPDYSDISPVYAETIVKAYKYEITSGVDAAGTFLPKAYLSRAELCQLFYNLNWTNPLQNVNI